MKAKKELGQNFLINKSVVKDLLKAAKINGGDVVLEIGAGKGFVTEELAKVAKKVIAVEFDRDLIEKLKSSTPGVEVINEDILTFLDRQYDSSKHRAINKIVGSIPYQITSPLIHKLILSKNSPGLVALLMQYEVAKKITASPPNASYLSNFVQAVAEVRFIKKVKKESFAPIPKVDGGIIRITLKPSRLKPANLEGYTEFLHRGFKNPRKMLNKTFDRDILRELEINPKARPQELKVSQWLKIYQHIYSNPRNGENLKPKWVPNP